MPEAPSAPPPPAPNLAPPTEERGNIPAESASQHADALGDAFSEMERAFGEAQPESRSAPIPADKQDAPAKPEPKPDSKPGEPQRGPDGKFLPRKDDPKPAEQPKPAEPAVEKMAAPELRKAYAELRKKHAALESERKQEREKAAAAPPAQPPDDPEKQQLTERLTEREKRLEALESELRYAAYERSQEYKEKYEQPFISAWQVGQDRASRLKTAEQKNDLEEVVTPSRQGTADDFNNLMQIQDDNEAADWATKTFGAAKAQLLLYHRERVQEANMAKTKALEQFKTQGSEREKQRQSLIENHTKAVRQLYHKTVQAGIDKYPELFKPDDSDPKTKTLLEKGMRLADRGMGAPDIEGEKPLTAEERIKLQAAIRNMAGSFQNLAYQLKRERTVRADLEKRLADYEESVPKGGDGHTAKPSAPKDDSTPEQAFDNFFSH